MTKSTAGYIGTCSKHGNVAHLETADGRRMFNWNNGELYCAACGRAVRWVAVMGRVSEAVCNSKCMGAISGACDCSCGGKNHGAA